MFELLQHLKNVGFLCMLQHFTNIKMGTGSYSIAFFFVCLHFFSACVSFFARKIFFNMPNIMPAR